MQAGQRLTHWALAGITGFLTSLTHVVPLVQLYLCSSFAVLGCSHDQWEEEVAVSHTMVDDLTWIASNIWLIHGAPLWCLSQVAVVTSNTAQTQGWGGFFMEMNLMAHGVHMVAEQEELIHLLKLCAVLWVLASFTPHLHGQQVECQTDNMVVLAYLANGGSKDPVMNQLVHQIHGLLASVNVSLYKAVWICGSLNVKVDMVLWWVDQDNWELNNWVLAAMHAHLSDWVVDCFANHLNAKADHFNSLFWVPGMEAVDAFSQDWSSGMSLLILPFCLLLHVLHHLVESQALAVLVFPVWEAQPWWPVLLHMTVQSLEVGEG